MKVNPSFAINAIVDDTGRTVDLVCGNWITSHRKACDDYARDHTIEIAGKRDLVIVSCGGYPHDINMIQAHKALEAASHACNEGGTIVLLAECSDGLGRTDFLEWFESGNSAALAEMLCKKYQVNGQTAWSLLKKAEAFDIHILTELDKSTINKMGLNAVESLSNALRDSKSTTRGYILPSGATLLPSC